LLKAHIWKSPGNDQIQNYWLKTFPATHRYITKNFNSIIEEPEKAPAWLTTSVTYLIPNQERARKLETTDSLHA
jgi:hypothetical protein